MGDFNVDILEPSVERRKLFNAVREFDLHQMTPCATRIASVKIGGLIRSTCKLLDHMYVDCTESVGAGVLPFCGSDHFLAYIVHKKVKITCKQLTVATRNYKNWILKNLKYH